MGTLLEHVFTFMKISRWITLKVRNVSDKLCRDNRNTFDDQIFFSESLAVYEIMRKKCGGARQVAVYNNYSTIRCIRFASWITKDTRVHMHTHRICNTKCFFTATIVSRTRLSVTLHVHCLLLISMQHVST